MAVTVTGVGLLVRKNLDVKITWDIPIEHRCLSVLLEDENNAITFVNIYAPASGTKNKVTFYNEVQQILSNINTQIVLLGDFNLILDPLDNAKNFIRKCNERNILQQTIDENNLIDILGITIQLLNSSQK